MPTIHGLGFMVMARVDIDHARDTVTMRSITRFIIYINSELVYWIPKKHISCESSYFGSEFVAMKYCCKYIHGLQLKLPMMSIKVYGSAYIFDNNKYVIFNTTTMDYMLKKKSQSIAYHLVQEGATRNE